MEELAARDRGYRRGLILGLSLAELFIILVFLLLLASIGFISALEKSKKEQNEIIDNLSSELSVYKEFVPDNILPEDFSLLIKQAAEAKRNRELLEKQAERMSSLEPLIEAIEEKEPSTLEKEKLIEALSEAAEEKDINKLTEAIQIFSDVDDDLLTEFLETADIKKANKELINKNNELAELVEALGKERGDNPPCLYYSRSKTDPLYSKKPYKEIYSFDIFMNTNSVIVVPRELEQGNYGDYEKNKPLIDNDLFNRKISYAKFRKNFDIFREIGETKLVQPYPCAFFARVWWDKSMSSVQYEKSITQVNSIFFKDIMRNSKWPHDNR